MYAMDEQEQKYCIYTQLDNGIHEFIFTESSRAALDEMANHIKEILKNTPDDAPPTSYLASSNEVELLPLSYLRTQTRKLIKLRPANREPGRLAVLYDGYWGNIVNVVLTMILKSNLRFFRTAKREDAIEWLLRKK
jgi:hypothetical protein